MNCNEKSKCDSLEVSCAGKTHDVDVLFSVIISNIDTRRTPVALFLQENLDVLPHCDPFLVKKSEDEINYMKLHRDN